jgi:hypothetical protein
LVTESYASELVFLERFDVLDQLYEEITSVMPERVRYFFKLGMLRRRDDATFADSEFARVYWDLGA